MRDNFGKYVFLQSNSVSIAIENGKHLNNIKTIGRTLRILSRHVPLEYKVFEIILSMKVLLEHVLLSNLEKNIATS